MRREGARALLFFCLSGEAPLFLRRQGAAAAAPRFFSASLSLRSLDESPKRRPSQHTSTSNHTPFSRPAQSPAAARSLSRARNPTEGRTQAYFWELSCFARTTNASRLAWTADPHGRQRSCAPTGGRVLISRSCGGRAISRKEEERFAAAAAAAAADDRERGHARARRRPLAPPLPPPLPALSYQPWRPRRRTGRWTSFTRTACALAACG